MGVCGERAVMCSSHMCMSSDLYQQSSYRWKYCTVDYRNTNKMQIPKTSSFGWVTDSGITGLVGKHDLYVSYETYRK